jgi:uncharacterized protein DUF4357
MQPHTIQIFLPDGNPRGVRLAEITSRTVQVIQVPRPHLDQAASRDELCTVGVYFLVGDLSDGLKPQVYVGEAEDCLLRLKQHHKQKEFWTNVLVVVSRTQYFTKSHVKFLEWYCHQAIGKSARFSLVNTASPTKPYVSESMEADLLDNFDTLRILVSTLGYPLFEEIKKPAAKDTLNCRGKDADARGEYTEDGLVVFSGSTANLEEVRSAGSWVISMRLGLIEEGVLAQTGNVLRFARDHVFSSPSAAAATVLARRANGWTEWKYPDGRTLDEVIRKPAED